MKYNDLERISSWLRCYPVAGREDERKSLTDMVEREISMVHCLLCGRAPNAHPLPNCPTFCEQFGNGKSPSDYPTYNDLRFK